MPISDKTRKILWGRSGNRCVICKHELVVEATETDDESIVGDECHIVSGRQNGPRYDATYEKEQLDSCENLILLCRIHHKMVDDQDETYTTDILRQMKRNHENWVAEKLTHGSIPNKIKIRRVKGNEPAYLNRLTTGKEILDLVHGCCSHSFGHDELQIQEEVDLIGGFMQVVSDWVDIGPDLGPADRVRVAFDLSQTLKELEDAGFYVFGAREIQRLEGGISGPCDWPIYILRVLRKSNEQIIEVSSDDILNGNVQEENASDAD